MKFRNIIEKRDKKQLRDAHSDELPHFCEDLPTMYLDIGKVSATVSGHLIRVDQRHCDLQ